CAKGDSSSLYWFFAFW
nr:immunoglobulin heavy chain junction region [Macaca mulatta]MOW33201.1 immunoglobulin heavy chain junction region [Macaca mulatta]